MNRMERKSWEDRNCTDEKSGARRYLLPKNGNVYKANLHCHTNLSDGQLSPEAVKELYRSHGYSVVAYTDHSLFIPHHELTDENFLALAGFEAEFNEKELFPGKRELKSCHLCLIAGSPHIRVQPCWNERYAYIGNAGKHWDKIRFDESEEPFERIYSPEGINELIRKGREAGFFVTYNHPAWSLETYEQYTAYEGMHAMEILNYGAEVMGYPSYAPNVYDDMLRKGERIFAVAADDNHNRFPEEDPRCDSFGGFVMIKAEELKYESIMNALFKGDFYASSGPEIYELYVEGNEIHVSCSDCVSIALNTGQRSARAVRPEKGTVINEATFTFLDSDRYLRITVKDAQGRFADTNACFLDTAHFPKKA